MINSEVRGAIDEFKEQGIKITWTLLSISFRSDDVLYDDPVEARSAQIVSVPEIIDYAIEVLESTDETDLLTLASFREDDEYVEKEIAEALIKLAEREKCDYDFELRKYRAMFFYKKLPPKDYDDYTDGMVSIYELWYEFGLPDNPLTRLFHSLEYTPENYQILLKAHEDWVREEFEALKEKSSSPSPEQSP